MLRKVRNKADCNYYCPENNGPYIMLPLTFIAFADNVEDYSSNEGKEVYRYIAKIILLSLLFSYKIITNKSKGL